MIPVSNNRGIAITLFHLKDVHFYLSQKIKFFVHRKLYRTFINYYI